MSPPSAPSKLRATPLGLAQSRLLVTASALRALHQAERFESSTNTSSSTSSLSSTSPQQPSSSNTGSFDGRFDPQTVLASVRLDPETEEDSEERVPPDATGERLFRRGMRWRQCCRRVGNALLTSAGILFCPCSVCLFLYTRRSSAGAPPTKLATATEFEASHWELLLRYKLTAQRKETVLQPFPQLSESTQDPEATQIPSPPQADLASELTIYTLKCHNAPLLSKFYELLNYRALVDGDIIRHDLFKPQWEHTDTEKLWNTLDPWQIIARAKRYHMTGYISLTPGTVTSTDRFILEPSNKRLWHEDATWYKIVRGVTPICDLIPFERSFDGRDSDEGHPHWKPFIVLVLNRILVSCAGLQSDGHDSLRGVIAIQVIREMLLWRFIMRNAAHIAGTASVAAIPSFGEFQPTKDGHISVDGKHIGDVDDLNPCKWKTPKDISNGLLAWTTVKVNVITDARSLLRATDFSIESVSKWCTACLQFSAGKVLATAEAFVGLLRFMFVRQWLPPDSLANTSFCANEFLHRAVAVPELEAYLPELLGVENTYKSGHDIDTGAVTVFDTYDEGQPGISPQELPREFTAAGISLLGLPKAKSTRIVMSVPSSPLIGNEWQVPQVVPPRIDFKLGDKTYCLQVTGSSVECRRTGPFPCLKRTVRRINGVQTMWCGVELASNSTQESEASGATAVSNALAGAYGEDVCLHMLAWLHRGIVQIAASGTAASFVPISSLHGDMIVNQTLDFKICRRMVFGRRGHELYWLPGEGLSCFRVRDSANGTYRLKEVDALPDGVEVCRAGISMNFG